MLRYLLFPRRNNQQNYITTVSLIGACLISSLSEAQPSTVTSHTFFSVRPNFQSAMPERVSLFRNELLDECQGFGGAFEAVVYGGDLVGNGSLRVARYFLPPGCHGFCLNVKEFNPVQESNPANSADGSPLKDLEARHFNIRTVRETFASQICIMPQQRTIGVGFCYKQTLNCKCDGTTKFWFEGSLPIQRVENQTCLTEDIVDNGGGPRKELGLDNSPRVGSMKEALAQKSWLYGRITSKKRAKWGVADIELKIGYNSWACDIATINTYASLIIPTGTRVRGKELFQTVVGNNRHFGFSLGSSFAFEVWRKGCYTINMFVDNDTRYLFSNNQVRSFDLLGKPWSRYMETYKTSEDAAAAFATLNENSGTSGINLFTRCVRVSPHLSANFNTAFVLSRQGDCSSWIFEGGYNLFARQSEVLDLECSNTIANVALKGVNGTGQTTYARTIKNNFESSDYNFNQRYASISNCDIDLESASHPATISNIIYGSLGYRWERECPFFVSIGGSYEFTVTEINTSLDRYLLWGKIGVTF